MTNESKAHVICKSNTNVTEKEMTCFNHTVALLRGIGRVVTVDHMENGWTAITVDSLVKQFDDINEASAYILALLTGKNSNNSDCRESGLHMADPLQINTPDFQQARQVIEDKVNGEFEQYREKITGSLKVADDRGWMGVEVGWTYSVEGIPFMVYGVNFTQRLIKRVYYTLKIKGEVKQFNSIKEMMDDLEHLIKHIS